jgi:predicted Holliday junction resolvase-like endonuclease
MKERNKVAQQELESKKKEAELKVEFQQWAIGELEKFKQAEILRIRKDAEEQALNAANIVLQEWKNENEASIRQDAINRSYSVNLGKITEHLVPFSSSFLAQFNPKDARFIGSPIDLIVFDGCSDKKDEIVTYFVEIKTGNSRLTEIQKKIKAAIIKGEVRWAEINPDQQRPITIEYQGEILKPVTDPDEKKKISKLFDSMKVNPKKGT